MEVSSSISAAAPTSVSRAPEINSSSPPSFLTLADSSSDFTPIPKAKHRLTRDALTPSNVRLIKQAVRHAITIGLRLNVMVTIDWELCGIDPHSGRSHWLHLFYNWIRCRGHQTGFVWVMEGGGPLGIHSHILIHVPRELRVDFRKRQRAWRKAVGVPWKARVMKLRPIGDDVCDLQWVENYILKDRDAKARRIFSLNRPSRYCPIAGKRCGTSRNLGAGAIKKWQKS
jgi:hypothetical protein